MSEIQSALNSSLETGNSARFVRGLILPLACLAVQWVLKKNNKNTLVASGIIGIIAGFCILWSNDYGISCWICIQFVNTWLVFCQKRKVSTSFINLALSFVTSLLIAFILIETISLGNVSNWFSSTIGTGGYQRWYYNSGKSFYLWDIDTNFPTLLLIGLSLFFMYKMFISGKNQESLNKNTVLSFICITCFCAIQEYKLLSGGDSREVAYSALFIIIISELYDVFRRRSNDKLILEKTVLIISTITCLCWLVSACKEEVLFAKKANKEGSYIEQLGGYVTSLDSDLLRTDSFLNGKEFFATYASGQEVISNVYQPSGTDYIIHVLGDQQRAEYLKKFTSGNFDYAATIKESFTDWEYWVQRANWYFYRELYNGWHPVFTNSYETFWERNGENEKHYLESGFVVETEMIDETTCKIMVACEQPINGMADVHIDYYVSKRKGLDSVLCFQQMAQVRNSGTIYANQGEHYESNYLRPISEEYIPVRIVNGYGEITLSSKPERHTVLKVNSVSCKKILTVDSDYVEISRFEMHDGQSMFFIPRTMKNINAVHNAVTVEYGGSVSEINEILEDSNSNSIVLCCRMTFDQGDYCNMLRIIRDE